jgi:hypothetical protein
VSNSPDRLPGVIKEIASALLDGDWIRYSDNSGERFYYVIRERDHAAETDLDTFDNLYVLGKPEAGAFEEWYIRAALAEEPADRLAKFRRRIVAAGINPQFFDAVMAASRSATSPDDIGRVVDHWMPHFFTNGRADGLVALVEALRVDRVRQRQVFVSEADRPAIREALEFRFLKELVERYPKVVKRAANFDWLSFSDPQVREASRCYLYGFFRAAVLVATSGLENRLKTVCSVETLETYDKLVDCAFGPAGACGSDPTRSDALKEVFELRNRVAHEGIEPSVEQAAHVLDVVRETFDTLAEED